MLLAGRYQSALREHLKTDSGINVPTAWRLGRQSIALGLDTLGLARMHEQALADLGLVDARSGIIKRAEIFFTEVIGPVVERHRAGRESKMQLHRLNKTLNRRTIELAATNRQLKQGILRRKNVENALKKSGEHYSRLLRDSLQLQEGLRQLTHEVLTEQEAERKKISREL